MNNIESSTKKSGKSSFKRKHAELSNENNKKNKSCFFCGKKGHFKKECRFYKKLKMEENAGNKKKANVVEKPPSPAEIIAMVAGLNISMITECNMAMMNKITDWWYDSGATVHICNDRNLFKNYEAVSNEEKVLMGNNDTANVHGKGTVELQFTSGKKLVLLNVFHVPDVRKNLVSASLLCKKGLKAF